MGEEILEYLSDSFNNKQELIELADGKANILLGIVGIIISLFFALVVKDDPQFNFTYVILLLPFVISVVFALLVVLPRMKKADAQKSLLYFQHAERVDKDDFFDFIMEDSTKKIYHDYISNTKILSSIVRKKFTYLKYAYIFLAIGIGLKILLELMNWI